MYQDFCPFVTTVTDLIRQMKDWKMGTFFDKLRDSYAEYFISSEYLIVDEKIVHFKGRIIFK
jgi:hypothetical protein